MSEITYLTFAAAVVILMLKPGPFMATCMTLSLEGRWRSVVSFWLGYLVMRTGMYFFFLSTLTLLPQGFGIIFIFLKAFAALLLITMGFKGIQAANNSDAQAAKELKAKLKPNNFLANFSLGGLIQVSNPYDYVFILLVIPGIFGTNEFSPMVITNITLIVCAVDLVVNLAYILPILYFQKKIYSPEILKKIKIGTSICLILIGAYIFATMFFRDAMVKAEMISAELILPLQNVSLILGS